MNVRSGRSGQHFVSDVQALDGTGRRPRRTAGAWRYRAFRAAVEQTRTEALEDTDALPPPELLATEVVDGLEAALVEFAEIAA